MRTHSILFGLLIISVVWGATQVIGGELRGSVFIVTNSGTGLKLPLARIYFLSEDELAAYTTSLGAPIAKISEEYQRRSQELESRASRLADASANYDEARSEARARQQAYSERRAKVIAALSAPKPSRRDFKSETEFSSAVAAWERAKNDWPPDQDARAVDWLERTIMREQAEYQAKRAALEVEAADLRSWRRREIEKIQHTEPALPPATLTDADGAFSAEPPRDAAYVLIFASRATPPERYRWIVPLASLKRDSSVVLFSNHNMAD
ncbi:MAG: hypothetical protein KBC32_11100 [Candidatus Didemnitutus sp.]|nr:hypothetical protein [Candidatus Didemnitutus sp.]